jgi:nicotinic acid mononucleotide adenylyltransferase
VQMDISATRVRKLVSAGLFLDWPALVPQPVAEFIGKYRLYRDKA